MLEGGTITRSSGKTHSPQIRDLAGRGLLPTPMASDASTGEIIGEHDRFVTNSAGTLRKINRNGTDGSVGLARMARLLPTPNAAEGEKYSKRYNPESQMGKGLTSMAVNGLLPTPTAQESRGNASVDRGKFKLTDEIARIYSPGGGTSQLNPLYVSDMMGFPVDWTVSPFLGGGRSR